MIEIEMRGPARSALGSEMLSWVIDPFDAAKGEPSDEALDRWVRASIPARADRGSIAAQARGERVEKEAERSMPEAD